MGARESRVVMNQQPYQTRPMMMVPNDPRAISMMPTFPATSEGISFCDYDKGAIWRDILTPDLLEYIPNHWAKFPPPSTCTHFMLAILYALIFVFGCGGNALVVILFLKKKHLRTPSNMLLFNLAVNDFIMIVKTPVFIYNSYKCGPSYGTLGCDIYGFLGGLSGNGAIMSVAFAALDRYNVISNPLNPKRLTKTTASLVILFVWIYSSFFALLPLLKIYNRFTYEGYLTSCTVDYLSENGPTRNYVLVYFFFAWCIPIAIIIYSYWGIIKAVGKSERNLRRIEDSTHAVKDKGKSGSKEEIAIAKTAAMLISLWLVSWTPYAVIALMGAFGYGDMIDPSWSMIPALTAKTAATLDPWVYSLSHPKFKKEFEALFFKKQEPKSDDTATVETKY